jgi:BirA family biotin operon repressor/biotin-[acetyl-CoA-carboxylase] ligase
VLFRPSAPVALLPLAAGVAVAEAMEALGVAARLKWPNDVMIGDRKVGGVLAEASSGPRGPEWVVLGIGLNVGAAPSPELAPSAISLSEAASRAVSVEHAAVEVLGRVAVWYHRLLDGGSGRVLNAWREWALPWWGERVCAWSGDQAVAGRALGLDDEGGLVLELDDGSRSTLRSGEVRRVRPGDL